MHCPDEAWGRADEDPVLLTPASSLPQAGLWLRRLSTVTGT